MGMSKERKSVIDGMQMNDFAIFRVTKGILIKQICGGK